jgi:hypothetical protein
MQGTQECNEDDLKYQRSIRRKIIWRVIVCLGGGALVLFLAVLFITNPGILSGPIEYLQSLSQGKSAQSPGQANASASPVAKKTFNTPEDYLDLMTTDAAQLSKDQVELVQIFNEALSRLTVIDKSEANAKATAGPIILQSVTTAQSKEDFDKIRAAVESSKTAATRDLNSLQSFEKDLTVPLQGGGIKPPMDAQVASLLAARTNLPDKIQKANNVIKFADASKAYCDFLEKNRGDWSFKGQGRAFKDRKILDEAIALGKQFTQSAVDAGFQFNLAEGSASPSPSTTP